MSALVFFNLSGNWSLQLFKYQQLCQLQKFQSGWVNLQTEVKTVTEKVDSQPCQKAKYTLNFTPNERPEFPECSISS